MQTKRKYLFGTTILAGVVAVSAPAFAQSLPDVDVQGQQQSTEIGEVVVTGSRIRRDPTTAPTPLIQVQREQLLETGQSTVIDYLATIPALSNSLVPSDTTGSGLNDGGLSFANLRSLGSGRTLTLVNGRRHVGSQGGSLAVDIDTIPRLLIENIEIVTGGASSVYGADAVSGVLNFVLRQDFEGMEIDANYGMINQDGTAKTRVSVLTGANLLDDRLNVWAFGEYETLPELRVDKLDWAADSWNYVGVDADPTVAANGPPADGIIDARVFKNTRTMQRLRWGVVNLANNVPGSALNDPDIAYVNQCGTRAAPSNASEAIQSNVNCTQLLPGKTWVFDGPTARLADFGTRIGLGRSVLNIGGDGEPAGEYATYTLFPENEAKRFATGLNFRVTDNITAHLEAKYVTEENIDTGQPTFFDIFINNLRGPSAVSRIRGTSAFDIRLSDNAYIPANLRAAILANTIDVYDPPTIGAPSTLATTVAAPYARSALRGPDRSQRNVRELTRYVASIDGTLDNLFFVRNLNWDLGYTYGQVEVSNREVGVDVERMAFAADAIVDTAGIVNGRPGEIVCRVQVLNAQGVPLRTTDPVTGAVITPGIQDWVRGGDVRSSATGRAAINQCTPLNVFGAGNQSQASLDYIYAEVGVTERNEQEQAMFSVAGQLWDFWGAGPIGIALGGEKRREFTEGTGRDREYGDRFLFLNSGPDQPAVEYESDELFAELSLPLLRDSWLGEYAELSGSYRYFDYTTVGTGDVYGVNLVYRPIRDITFRSSFNTSFRAPNLSEIFSPYGQTFANFTGGGDPCVTSVIAGIIDPAIKANRIANCTTLAARAGLTFNFSDPSAANAFNPAYGTGGTAGVAGGNPFLRPETSESFTFSTVISPRFFPDFTLVLDYYEIEISDVIAAISPLTAAAQCVNGPTLNEPLCATIIRNNPTIPFGIGAPTGDPIGGFIQGSVNYAKRTSRGLDFTARYRLDTEEAFGRNWGQFNASVNGTWFIEQKQFNNASNPNDYTQLDSAVYYPRVRLTSSLTWVPNDTWSFNWTMDWQSSQDITLIRTYGAGGNSDARLLQDTTTGNFARHDFSVRYNLDDNLTLRAGVTNAFDAEQARVLGSALTSNFDPYGTRFNIGLNWRPY